MLQKYRSGCFNVATWGRHGRCCRALGLRFRCCIKRFKMFHLVLSDVARSDLRCFHPVLFDVAWSDLRYFTIVLMMLQHFVSRVSSATLTCYDICILMFHCDLANAADVEFRCCRCVMLGFVLRRRERRAIDVGCCTQHWSQHVRNIVATWGEGRKAPDVGCYT
jgi:hypothetical protein